MSNSLQAKSKKTDPPIPAEVDELGQLQAWLALNKSKIDREEELRHKIAACYDEAPAAEEFQVEGEKFIAVVSPRGNERKILDYKKLYKLLTPPVFFRLCSIALGKLDAMIPEGQQKGLVEWNRSGSRRVKVVVKVAGE